MARMQAKQPGISTLNDEFIRLDGTTITTETIPFSSGIDIDSSDSVQFGKFRFIDSLAGPLLFTSSVGSAPVIHFGDSGGVAFGTQNPTATQASIKYDSGKDQTIFRSSADMLIQANGAGTLNINIKALQGEIILEDTTNTYSTAGVLKNDGSGITTGGHEIISGTAGTNTVTFWTNGSTLSGTNAMNFDGKDLIMSGLATFNSGINIALNQAIVTDGGVNVINPVSTPTSSIIIGGAFTTTTMNDRVLFNDTAQFQGGDVLITSTNELQFRDTDLAIRSLADGQLNIQSDNIVQLSGATLNISTSAVVIDGDISSNGALLQGGNASLFGSVLFGTASTGYRFPNTSGADGQFLQIDANADLKFTTLPGGGSGLGGTVSGTGTDNELAIWTNGSTIEGDSRLTYDGTTFAVSGVTSTFASDIDVSGTSLFRDTGSFIGDLRVGSVTHLRGDTTIGGDAGTGSVFWDDSATHLHINSLADAELTLFADTDNVTETHNPAIHFKQDGGGITTDIGLVGNSNTVFRGAIANSFYIVGIGGIPIQFGNSGSSNITMEVGGNVGIGRGFNNPTVLLDVSGGDVLIRQEIEIDGNLDHDGARVGFFGTTPDTQATDIQPITDATTGTPNGSMLDVTGGATTTVNVARVNDNFADLGSKVNQLREVLQKHGLMA